MKLIFSLIPILLIASIIPILIYADSIIIPTERDMEIVPDKLRYFAKIENNTVTNVIVADPDFILNHMEGTWIETWMEDDNPRKRYAGIGHTYNATLNAFIPEKPFDSWILNTTSAMWDAPIKKPDDNHYWEEKIPDWVRNE